MDATVVRPRRGGCRTDRPTGTARWYGRRRLADQDPQRRARAAIAIGSAWNRSLVRALDQYPLGPEGDNQLRPALGIADHELLSVVKTTAACDRTRVDEIVGLRVRIVPQRSKRTPFVISPERMSIWARPWARTSSEYPD